MVNNCTNNFTISPQQVDGVSGLPTSAGPALYYDASTGTAVGTGSSSTNPYDGENLGSGVGVYKTVSGNTFEFKSLEAGAGVQLSQSGDNIVISSSDASSATFVVNTIAERNALTGVVDGNLVLVKDIGNGSNEYGLYMWMAATNSYIVLSTQDSAIMDGNTWTYTVNYDSAPVIVLGSISSGHRAMNVTVKVIVPFNGTLPLLGIGDDVNGSGSVMSASENDLASAGQYAAEGTVVYTGSVETPIKAYYTANGSTAGQAKIILSYV